MAGLDAAEVSIYADDSYTQAGHPLAIILSDDGYIYRLDEMTGQDGDTDIECVYETMDVSYDNEEHIMRILWFSFSALTTKAGSTANIYYSTDGGLIWTEFDDSPTRAFGATKRFIGQPRAQWVHTRLPLDTVCRRIRFKISQNSSKDLQIRKMHYARQLETDRN